MAVVTPLGGNGHADLRAALGAAGLVTDDLDNPGCTFFALVDGTGAIGFVGLEGGGPDRLLRSLVVLPDRRGYGHGRQLVAAAEAEARSDGVRRLHLLTTSAADFFAALGFRSAARIDAPAAIACSAQFTRLCPGSVAYLIKDIA